MGKITLILAMICIAIFFLFSNTVLILLTPFLIAFFFIQSECVASLFKEKNKDSLSILSLVINIVLLLIESVLIVGSVHAIFLMMKKEYSLLAAIIAGLVLFIIFMLLFRKATKRGLILQKYVDKHEDEYKPAKVIFPTSDADELRKWKQLYDEGTISEEMFNKKRDQIINK